MDTSFGAVLKRQVEQCAAKAREMLKILGAYADTTTRLADVFDTFPRLKERVRPLAGTMSGGEQSMLSIGRGLWLRANC